MTVVVDIPSAPVYIATAAEFNLEDQGKQSSLGLMHHVCVAAMIAVCVLGAAVSLCAALTGDIICILI